LQKSYNRVRFISMIEIKLNNRRKALGISLESLARSIDWPTSKVHKRLTGALRMKYEDAEILGGALGYRVALIDEDGGEV
jgi:hypothetical protein